MALDLSGSSLLCEYLQWWQQGEKRRLMDKKRSGTTVNSQRCPIFANISQFYTFDKNQIIGGYLYGLN
ncbi:hypothetical protein E4659_03935 [Dickeya dianthicola]|uniref:hypothetical protein n=1 Tax=Dickeya dianthicola TaxID=204039 RepID=UPI0011874A79|nr:hypothetical protein [Dickeya dianthicola]MBI0436498.1 hypothetical protein [Dickeya dianthicola]MBI0448224.1 hypothetical protein [Dickeya dianthicola]MBI0452838.1 hypothetical protein [Dickeya dianthicola]MBI0457380.1 hypothetical protein [Dickeya dianthicola]MBI0461808.1 hypothetical protein [Dickeya dianthicola]